MQYWKLIHSAIDRDRAGAADDAAEDALSRAAASHDDSTPLDDATGYADAHAPGKHAMADIDRLGEDDGTDGQVHRRYRVRPTRTAR